MVVMMQEAGRKSAMMVAWQHGREPATRGADVGSSALGRVRRALGG